MVIVTDAILALVPSVTFGDRGLCVVTQDAAGVEHITYWDATLPAQPTAAQLAAVTPAQVTAAQQSSTIAAAGTALATAADPVSVANRANASASYTRINDVAEGLWAALQVMCAAAKVPVPTAAQIQAQIQANRAATPVDAGATGPATVAATCGVRLLQPAILDLIGATLQAGGGLPTG